MPVRDLREDEEVITDRPGVRDLRDDEEVIEDAPEAGFMEGVGRGAAEQVAGNIAAVPRTIGRMAGFSPIMGAIEGARRTAGLGGDPSRAQVFDPNIPAPSGSDVFAGAQVASELPGGLLSGEAPDIGGRFRQAQEAQQAESARIREDAPIGTAVGGLLGDAATLLTGRAPGTIARGRMPGRVPPQRSLGRPAPRVTIGKISRDVRDSQSVQSLARGVGRAGEAGVETAMLAALNDEDPASAFGVGAGAQAVGSASRMLFPPTGKGLGRFGIAVAGLTAATRLAQEFTPSEGNIFESADFAFDKLKFGLVAGAAATVAGAGRGAGANRSDFVNLAADALTTIPRGALQSFLREQTEALREGDDTIERVSTAMRRDPEAFTDAQHDRLVDALQSEDASFRAEANRLLDDQAFRERLEAVESKTDEGIVRERFREAIRTDTEDSEPPRPTRVAEAVAGTLPRNDPRRRSFENQGPRTFIRNMFQGRIAASELRKDLGKRRFREAQEVLLNDLIARSMRERDGGNRGLDGERLGNQWLRLDAKTRESFPKATREAMDGFVSLAREQDLSVLPPLAARALMKTGGQLVNRLRGTRTTQKED